MIYYEWKEYVQIGLHNVCMYLQKYNESMRM